MHMRAKNIIAVAVAGIACASAYGFKTNYVDCTLADYTGHDGTSWTKAFKTIQEGVEAAVAGDLVYRRRELRFCRRCVSRRRESCRLHDRQHAFGRLAGPARKQLHRQGSHPVPCVQHRRATFPLTGFLCYDTLRSGRNGENRPAHGTAMSGKRSYWHEYEPT
jgi:hypothetical protein